MEPAVFLVLACVVDTLIGDPSWLPHPIRLIGKAIEKGEQWLRQGPSSPGQDFFRGLGLVVGIVMATYVSAVLLLPSIEVKPLAAEGDVANGST